MKRLTFNFSYKVGKTQIERKNTKALVLELDLGKTKRERKKDRKIGVEKIVGTKKVSQNSFPH